MIHGLFLNELNGNVKKSVFHNRENHFAIERIMVMGLGAQTFCYEQRVNYAVVIEFNTIRILAFSCSFTLK